MPKSNRLERFHQVADICAYHIETYTVPQYGDFPDDQLTEMRLSDIKHDLQRYINRMGRNSRGPHESMRDMLKVMHYAAEAYLKMNELHGGDGDEN